MSDADDDETIEWPNQAAWAALKTGVFEDKDEEDGDEYELFVVDCGVLQVPSGKLAACDPFAAMRRDGNPHIKIPPGRYAVRVTCADLSAARDRSDVREAYATLMISEAAEATRRPLALLDEGEDEPELAPGEYVGFPVDAGTACFVDDAALKTGMPDESTWHKGLFENDRPDGWFNLMDSPKHLREGLANVPLPTATDGTNLILFHSGWGDGVYPVVGGYDANGALVRVHIDFGVVQ